MARSIRPALVVELTLAATVALLAAFGVSEVLRMAVDDAPSAIHATPTTGTATPPPLARFEAIAARDPFGPATHDGDLPLVLWGVAIDGEASHAVLEDTATKRQDLYRVGDDVAGARITAIGWDHVVLRRGDEEVTVALAGPSERTAPSVAATVADAPEADAGGGIRRVSATAFVVDRRAVDDLATNGATLANQMRAIAEVREGRPSGFRVFKIQDGSLVARLGLENGDVVERLNGAAVTDPANLLGFLDRLRTEPRVAVDIVRGGERRTLVYDLR